MATPPPEVELVDCKVYLREDAARQRPIGSINYRREQQAVFSMVAHCKVHARKCTRSYRRKLSKQLGEALTHAGPRQSSLRL